MLIGSGLSAITTASPAVAEGTANLVVNGGFNQGFVPWQVMPLTNYATYGPGVTGNDPYEGTQFAATNTTDGNGGIFQDVPVSINVGDTFCGSAQVATQGAGTGASGYFAVWLLGGGGNENSGKGFANLPGGNSWTPVQACVTATTAHTSIRIQFYDTPHTPTLVVDNVEVHAADTPQPALQLEQMATASSKNDRRQYAFALAEDKRIWATEQVLADGPNWSNWYRMPDREFCKAPVTIVNTQGFIEVFGVGCDMAVYRAIQTGAGPNGWSGWHLVGSCCINSKLSVIMDNTEKMLVFGVGTDGQLYTLQQTAPRAGTWTAWQGLGGYLTSTPVAAIDIYGHPYVYALGGDKNAYYLRQSSLGGPTFGQWQGWYGIGGGPFAGELALLAGVVGRRTDGRFYVAQPLTASGQEHNAWQPLGTQTFGSDAVNANSVIRGRDFIFGGYLRTIPTIVALGTDQQAYVNQACMAGMSCYGTGTYWTGWHLAAPGTFLAPPVADWTGDYNRLQLVGMGMARNVYVNNQTAVLNLNSWNGWRLKPGGGVRSDCTLTWQPGKVFYYNEFYVGCDGQRLVHNGKLTLFDGAGNVKWQSPTPVTAGRIAFQTDGNLVAYNTVLPVGGTPLWATGTSNPNATLNVGRDGNVVILNESPTRHPVWWSNKDDCRTYEWSPGKVFVPGEYWVTCNGDMLSMNKSDGNVYQIDHLGEVAWSTSVSAPNGRMEFRGDGTVAVTDSSGAQVWSSETPVAGAKLTFDDYGNVAVVDQVTQEPKWVKLEANKTRLLKRIDEYIAELNKIKDRPEVAPRYAFLLEQALNFKDELSAFNPRQPCADAGDVITALLGFGGAATGLWDLLKGTASTALKGFFAVAGVFATWYGLVKIFGKCANYKIMERIVEEYRDERGPAQIGFVEEFKYQTLDFPWEVVWVDFNATPVPPDADFRIAYEGDPDFYQWELIDSLCCDYWYPGGGGGGDSYIPDYDEWRDFADEELA
ncbi:MAG TPA: hypothetical protein VF062_13195 [Candidatus Limnocylindrales bacterium]